MLNIRRSAHLMCIALFILCGLQRASCQYQHYVDTLRANELYEYIDTTHPIKYLQNGDSEFDSLLLDNPISFYSEKYDQIFINTNGILTFNIDFPDYINQPLPLEYPSIAPFYANIDTSSSGSISIFESQNEEQLQRANSLVRYAYVDKAEFTATRLIVATWKDVGYFNSKTDKLNTFQVVLIFNDEETFVQFIYPSGGLNWLRAETGESGFPDIRAQAGFVAEDGRFHTLEDSGSDHVKFLSDNTNVGVGGVWLYRVGAFDYTDNVESPTNAETLTEPPMREQQTCAEGSHRFCDAEASCFDKSSGFCCVCQEGFYGNGRVCLKDNIPIRVAGTINGQINGQPIDERAKLQSYVSTSDAHTYTAITPASAELASQLRLALPLITTIGWLFAKPVGGVLNGYQLTGGELSHTAQIHFETGEVLVVNQTFEGLDYWDQLSVKIDLFGDVPHVNYAAKLVMPEFIEEFRFVSPYELQSMHSHLLEIPEENRQISFQLDQHIRFERCLLDSDADPTDTKFMQKSSKLVFDYLERDQAWRPSVLTKVGVDVESNACTDGTAICGENTVCVPYEDIFRCDCLHGYAPEVDETGYERCVDIDECAQGTHVCDENAWCTNNEGGFSCVCFEGYEGNGYRCLLNNTADNIESSTRADPYQPGYQQPSYGQEYEGNSNNEVDRSREDDRYGNGNDDRYGNGNEDRYGNGNEDPYGNGNDDRYSNNNDDRYPSNNDDRYDDRYANNNDVEHDRQHSVYDQHVSTYDSKMDDCTRCSPDANCIDGRCECREGFEGNGFSCQQICGHDKVWENGNCVPIIYEDHEVEPVCTIYGDCECKEGYELVHERQMCRYIGHYETDSKPEDLVPCDVDDNCHANATCEWFAQLESHMCTCNPGFYGDGYQCVVLEESCAIKPEICDANADCNYNDATGKSECSCRRGYVGDGFHCQLAPECQADADCGLNSYCDNGVCQCNEGFERDVSDTCLPAGRCGAVFCGANSVCKWDAQQGVQYCECMDGYEGDAVEGCRSIPPPCNVRNNCGVHATCEPTEDPRRYECQCNAGYHGDGYVCIEEQNCLNNPHMCDMNAQCASTNSGLVCVCNQGFYGNGSVCFERQQYESGFLLVSQGVVIVRVPLNGKRVRPISVASMAIGLDKDCLEGRIYWGDISAKKIISAKYDGTDARDFITEDIESPEGIAIDSSSRRIYWTDSVKDTIEVASLEDPQMRAVLVNKNLVNPRGIAVDAFRQKLYWSDWNREDPKIEMSDLDGTGREILLGSDSVTLPNSLVVLARSGELCYADAGTKKVECIDSYSKQKRTISNELTYPFGLTFTQNNFYWTDWFTKKLESVDAFGERQKGIQTSFFGSHKMYGMTAIDNECPQIDSPCQINNGGCTDSRICLVNHKAPSGKSCKCTASSQLCPVSTLYAAPVAAAAPAAP